MSATEPPLKQRLLTPTGEITRPWWMWFTSVYQTIGSTVSIILGIFTTESGRIKSITRITSSYTVKDSDHAIFADTDSGVISTSLPAGIEGTEYELNNTGSSGNDLTVTPNGSELLFGSASSFALIDSEGITIKYNSIEGWR